MTAQTPAGVRDDARGPGASSGRVLRPGGGGRPRICILARKNLTHNTRVVRQARVLEAEGYDVTIVALQPPSADLMDGLDHTRVRIVKPEPRALRWLRSRFLRIVLGQRRRWRWNKAYTSHHGVDAVVPPPPIRSLLLRPFRPLAHKVVLAAVTRSGLLPRDGRLADRDWVAEVGTHEVLMEMTRAAMPILMNRAFAEAAEAAVRHEAFDVVQAHDSLALEAAARVARRAKAPCIYDAVEIPDDRSGWTMNHLPRWMLEREARLHAGIIASCARVFTVSQGLADWMAEHYGIATPELVRNCRYWEAIVPDDRIRRACGLKAGERLALYLNSLYPGQGLEQLVDSLEHLPPQVHIATLGPEARQGYVATLRARAAERGLDGRFHVLEPVSPADMLQYAAGADIGVVPRQNTSFNNYISLPNRVFELTMARLPIAAPSLPDMARFVAAYGIGLSFDETDPVSIAAVIARMLEPEALAGFRAAAEEAATELSWDWEGRRYVRIVAAAHGAVLPA